MIVVRMLASGVQRRGLCFINFVNLSLRNNKLHDLERFRNHGNIAKGFGSTSNQTCLEAFDSSVIVIGHRHQGFGF